MKKILHYISLTWSMFSLTIASALEYKVGFFVQVFGMLINDIGLISVWFIFFAQFPSINGWERIDTNLLFAISTVGLGIMCLFQQGIRELGTYISQGELDRYLTLPKSLLWHVGVSKSDIPAIGDIAFGLIVFFFFTGPLSLENVAIFCSCCFLIAIMYFNFIVITQSITFFAGQFDDAADQMFWALLGFTLYPQNVFSGALKIVSFTLLPAFFIAAVPVSLIRNFSFYNVVVLLGFVILTSVIMVFFFRLGLRRYESGNLMTIKK